MILLNSPPEKMATINDVVVSSMDLQADLIIDYPEYTELNLPWPGGLDLLNYTSSWSATIGNDYNQPVILQNIKQPTLIVLSLSNNRNSQMRPENNFLEQQLKRGLFRLDIGERDGYQAYWMT